MGCFWPNYIMLELKKYRGIMFDCTQDWFKVWRITGLCFQKLTRNLAIFHQSTWKSPNWDLDGILLSKFEYVWAWNLQGNYVSWQWRMMQKSKRSWLVSSKLTWGIWRILTWAFENLKKLHFNGLLLTKVYNVWAKEMYRGVMFDGIEYWCKIWRKTGLCFLSIFVYRLKNSDFILESQMAELSWKQNLLIHFENCQNVPYSHE